MRLLHARFCQRRDRADRTAAACTDCAQRCGGDGFSCAREPYLPLHRVRALLRSRSQPDPENPRPDADDGMSRPRHLLRWVIGLGALAGVAIGLFFSINLLGGKTGGPVQVVNAPADVVARGRYLAEAADCAACHTAAGGAPFAGGLALQSGFGTIYATNITPDPDVGVGRWSADDFWRALHDGMRRDGQQLYPAMPYTSYRGMTRADTDAIYAYVMQLRPAKAPNRITDLRFPFNIRLGMRGWNLFFLTD